MGALVCNVLASQQAAHGTCSLTLSNVMASTGNGTQQPSWCLLESRGIHHRSFHCKFSIQLQCRRCSRYNEIQLEFHYGVFALLDKEDGARRGWYVTAGHRLDYKPQHKVCITEHSELLQLWTNSIIVWLQAECTVQVFRERQTQEMRRDEEGRRPREQHGNVSLMLNYSFLR